jgi:hypothetical protein
LWQLPSAKAHGYELDFTTAGRFLSMKMDYPVDDELSGLDVDLDILGAR